MTTNRKGNTMTTTTTQTQEILAILKDKGFDFIDASDIAQWDADTDFQEVLRERVNEQEIIYYTTAIDYLREMTPL